MMKKLKPFKIFFKVRMTLKNINATLIPPSTPRITVLVVMITMIVPIKTHQAHLVVSPLWPLVMKHAAQMLLHDLMKQHKQIHCLQVLKLCYYATCADFVLLVAYQPPMPHACDHNPTNGFEIVITIQVVVPCQDCLQPFTKPILQPQPCLSLQSY